VDFPDRTGAVNGARVLTALPPAFWNGKSAAPAGGACFAAIPGGCQTRDRAGASGSTAMTATRLFDFHLEHVGIMRAQLQAPPEVIGPGPEGLRVNSLYHRRRGHGSEIARQGAAVERTGSPSVPMASVSSTYAPPSKRTMAR